MTRRKRTRAKGAKKDALLAQAWGTAWMAKECHYCGKGVTADTATLDHIKPLSRGGRNEPSNIVIACHACNSEKGSRPYADFKAAKLPEKQRRRDASKVSVFDRPWA